MKESLRFLYVGLVLMLGIIATYASYAAEQQACVYQAYGCDYVFLIDGGTVEGWVYCDGDDGVYIGEGAYGGCPGRLY